MIVLGQQLLATKGDLSKVKTILEPLMPRIHSAHSLSKKNSWFNILCQREDTEAFRGHIITGLCNIPNMVVPKMIGLPDHYR